MKSAKSLGRRPIDPPRIETAIEALRHFDELTRRSLNLFHQQGRSALNRLDSRLLSPALIERIVRLGGEEELLVEEQGAAPVTIRLMTLARLLLQEIPKPANAITEFESGDYIKIASISVPFVLEAFYRRHQVLGLKPTDDSAVDQDLGDDQGDSNDDLGDVIFSSNPTLFGHPKSSGLQAISANTANTTSTTKAVVEKPGLVAQTPVQTQAGALELCSLGLVNARLAGFDKGGSRGNEHLVSALTALKARPWRRPAVVDRKTIKALESLKRDFPNFLPLIERYTADLQLKRLVGAPLVFRPIVLVGPPGIGKTAFMRRLSELMPVDSVPCAVATLSAGWILNGKNVSWNGSGPGLVAQAMLALPEGRGLMLWLDEVDKLSSLTANATVLPVLLELLEPLSRQTFRDEFLELPMNLLPFLSVLATANGLEGIAPPLLSRFQVVKVEAPTADQMDAVIRSVDRSIRTETPALGKVFVPLSDAVRAALGTLPPRQAYQVLEGAYSVAAARSRTGARRVVMTVADVQKALLQAEAGKQPVKAVAPMTGADEVIGAVLIRLPPSGTGGGGGGGPAGGESGSGGSRLH